MTTKVVCPKCGAEIAIPEHETLAVGISIGKDSGLGTIELPLASEETSSTNNKSEMKASQKIQAMRAAGINVENLFSVANAEGVERIARIENGAMQFLQDDDPIFVSIIKCGTVPNRRLFRRWVMGQMFHMLTAREYGTGKEIGFLAALQRKGYKYCWEMVIEEIRVQAKLEMFDNENFIQRNRWFNKSVVAKMAYDYHKQVMDLVEKKKKNCKKCKGVPYINISGHNIFLTDVMKKVFEPINHAIHKIENANSMVELYHAAFDFYSFVKRFHSPYNMTMSQSFKDAYKGSGAYYTMRNLIMFHGCKMRSDKGNPLVKTSSLRRLDQLAEAYKDGEGWRMFGVMKEMIEDNGIDIVEKMKEWRGR